MTIAWYDKAGKLIEGTTADCMDPAWREAMGKVEALLTDLAYKVVAREERDEVAVSTVWLGLDHRHGPGKPLILETMVFGGPLDGEQDRYSTEEEAVAGHAVMIKRVWPT